MMIGCSIRRLYNEDNLKVPPVFKCSQEPHSS